MAPGSCLCHSLHQNPLQITFDNNKLVGRSLKAPIESISSTTLIFHASIPALIFVTLSTNDELFKQFIQAYLEDYRASTPSVKQADIASKPFKTQNPDLHYRNSYMECYYFSK